MSLSENGQRIAFLSEATNLVASDGSTFTFVSTASDLVVGDSNAVADVFVFERFAGGLRRRVARSDGGTQANGASGLPALSRDGQKVAFESVATNLSSLDVNGALSDVFVNGPLNPDRVFRANFE